MEKKNEKHMLKCFFTDGELKEIANDMAAAIQERIKLESEMKSAQTHFKSRIAAEDAKVSEAANYINNGYELRMVECEVEFSPKKNEAKIIRKDNGETAFTRKMTEEERQLKIFKKE